MYLALTTITQRREGALTERVVVLSGGRVIDGRTVGDVASFRPFRDFDQTMSAWGISMRTQNCAAASLGHRGQGHRGRTAHA